MFVLFFNEITNLKLYKNKEEKTVTKFYTFCVKKRERVKWKISPIQTDRQTDRQRES